MVKKYLYHKGTETEIDILERTALNYYAMMRDELRTFYSEEINSLVDTLEDHIVERQWWPVWNEPEIPCFEIIKLVTTAATIVELLKVGYVCDVFLESEFINKYKQRDTFCK